ncbi:MAG: glycine zipper 2TM domain-containing protein [Pseudomonadales bacterium]|jgi:uncharacterized protein YcfJ
MRFVTSIFGVVVWCAATNVAAGHDATSDWSASAPRSSTYRVYADVVDVEPLVERHTITTPRQECSVVSDHSSSHSYPRYQHRHSDHADSRGSNTSGIATVVGGLIGGLVGNQFGAGSGRKALTVAGAILGASIANQASRDRRDEYASAEPRRCSRQFETREVEEIAGYLVRYRYHGQEFVKRMEHDPGERVRVEVAVTPVAWESAG